MSILPSSYAPPLLLLLRQSEQLWNNMMFWSDLSLKVVSVYTVWKINPK